MSTAAYDELGSRYAEHSATSPWNALYDRPAVLSLAGDVSGKDLLDVGCAAGHLTAEFAARGARVVGIDTSQVMIDLARARCGGRARFHRADLAEPLDFLSDDSFDLVVASLVLHYLRDWATPLGELRRVLRTSGTLVMSVHHPGEDWRWFGRPNYFVTELLTDRWPVGGQEMELQFYHRPLSVVFSSLRGRVSGWTTSWNRCRCRSARPSTRRRINC